MNHQPRLLAALRADVNPCLWGVLYDLQDTWMAIGPHGEYLEASSADELRRAIRETDGTTQADTLTWRIEGQ